MIFGMLPSNFFVEQKKILFCLLVHDFHMTYSSRDALLYSLLIMTITIGVYCLEFKI